MSFDFWGFFFVMFDALGNQYCQLHGNWSKAFTKKKKDGEKKVNMKEAIRISHTSSCLLTLSYWSHCKTLNYMGDVGNWCCNNTVYAYFHYLFIPIVHDHFKAVVILDLAWLHTMLE